MFIKRLEEGEPIRGFISYEFDFCTQYIKNTIEYWFDKNPYLYFRFNINLWLCILSFHIHIQIKNKYKSFSLNLPEINFNDNKLYINIFTFKLHL